VAAVGVAAVGVAAVGVAAVGVAAVGVAAAGAAAGADMLGVGAGVCCADAAAASKHSVPATRERAKMRSVIIFPPRYGSVAQPASLPTISFGQV
jgi:hypothetical protein